MQRTSRTPRATRVASAPCSGAPSPGLPSLLCLGLLVGAALAALWLLGGAPAHADSGRDTVGALPSAAANGSAPLSGVVPGEVAEPVSTTLETVHQRLQADPDAHAEPGGALTGATRPVADVGAEVIGAVGEADRALPDTDELGAVPALPLDEPHRPGSVLGTLGTTGSGEAGAEAGSGGPGSERAADDADRSEAADTAERGASAAAGAPAIVGPSTRDAMPAVTAGGHQDADPAPRSPEPPVGQSATASAATTGSSPAPAPGIAGYLTSAPLTAPGSDALRPAPRHHRAAPTAGTDDPTVSPD
ncbi:hypothetical protein [Nocardiopsis aegyptia]|uniref:Uncharacterized protein n=1 Tax=Nocardiopsis aegyptia TaxID=220378 RepID=A0A7Z0ENL7_9ACTN|nr:hypothetical protein [Nocardiopsis aegyptia]NYJ34525.1 hypothetical protein [Nocardiopsis aegyptia]